MLSLHVLLTQPEGWEEGASWASLVLLLPSQHCPPGRSLSRCGHSETFVFPCGCVFSECDQEYWKITTPLWELVTSVSIGVFHEDTIGMCVGSIDLGVKLDISNRYFGDYPEVCLYKFLSSMLIQVPALFKSSFNSLTSITYTHHSVHKTRKFQRGLFL